MCTNAPQKNSSHGPRGACKVVLHHSEKTSIFPENREISINFDVPVTCIIIRCLEWKGHDFKVSLSTLMPNFELLGPKYT